MASQETDRNLIVRSIKSRVEDLRKAEIATVQLIRQAEVELSKLQTRLLSIRGGIVEMDNLAKELERDSTGA